MSPVFHTVVAVGAVMGGVMTSNSFGMIEAGAAYAPRARAAMNALVRVRAENMVILKGGIKTKV